MNFAWPIAGTPTVLFGAHEEGVAVKGVVIRAYQDSRVMAAADGRVAYTNDNLPGYGRTVIIEHSAEFSSVYARNAAILVKVGQTVRQGEPIAVVGSKGKGGRPQLYFEIRRQSRAEDPLMYLKPKPQ